VVFGMGSDVGSKYKCVYAMAVVGDPAERRAIKGNGLPPPLDSWWSSELSPSLLPKDGSRNELGLSIIDVIDQGLRGDKRFHLEAIWNRQALDGCLPGGW
jgi:hypothetical protein